MRNLKIWYKGTYLQNKNRPTDRKQIYGYQMEGAGRDKLGVWDSQILTTIIKQISNEDLLYCTGNYTQYLVITYNGIKTTKSHSPVHLKVTQCCKSTIFKKKRILRGDCPVNSSFGIAVWSTWNSAQYYVAAFMGGEFGGEWIRVYVWLNHFTVHLKLSQHC